MIVFRVSKYDESIDALAYPTTDYDRSTMLYEFGIVNHVPIIDRVRQLGHCP